MDEYEAAEQADIAELERQLSRCDEYLAWIAARRLSALEHQEAAQ